MLINHFISFYSITEKQISRQVSYSFALLRHSYALETRLLAIVYVQEHIYKYIKSRNRVKASAIAPTNCRTLIIYEQFPSN